MLLAQSAPFTPNIANMCAILSTTRNQLIHLLSLLERAELIRQLHAQGKSLKALGKPDKILLNNTNLMHALGSTADAGTARESFFSAMMSHSHTIHHAPQGDLLVDEKYTFEVGGKRKGFKQIADLPDSYVVADNIETGFGNKIPLWLFGFIY
jgi:hypothetical protein